MNLTEPQEAIGTMVEPAPALPREPERPRRSPWPRIFGLSLLAGILAYIGAMFLPKEYETTTALYFPQGGAQAANPINSLLNGGGGGGADASISVGPQLNVPLVGASQQTAIGILMSRTSLLDVVARAGLAERWKTSPGGAVKKVRERIDIRTDKNGFLSINVRGDSPEQAVRIASILLAHLNATSEKLSYNIGRQVRRFLEKQVQQAELTVDGMQFRLERVMKGAPYSDPVEVKKRYADALTQLRDAQTREASAAAQLRVIEDSSRKTLSQGGTIAADIARYAALSENLQEVSRTLQSRRLALDDALVRYTETSPQARARRMEVEAAEQLGRDIRQEQKALVEQGLTPPQRQARADLAGLRAAIADLQGSIAEYRTAAEAAPGQYADVKRVENDYQAAMTTKNFLQVELERAKVAEARDPKPFEIVDPPVESPEPVAPSKSKLAISFFLLIFALQALPIIALKLREQPE